VNALKSRLSVESLEGRDMMSWTAVPANFWWPSSPNVSFNSNARAGTATISNNEVDVYNFVAPRTGTYTLTAGKSGSQVDTVLGVFRMNGVRLAGNDDANSNTTDSKLTVYLSGGTRYAFAVTNYRGTSTGGYRWSVTGPPLSRSLSNNAGNGISSFAFVTITGNSLKIDLRGINSSNWYYYDHKVEVRLVDGSGRAIHNGSWNFSTRSYGHYIPGPGTPGRVETFDLSGFDLRNLRNISITLW
jgi:hypothetical protein